MLIKVDKYASLEGPKFDDPASLIAFLSKLNLNGKVIHVKAITPELEALSAFGFTVDKGTSDVNGKQGADTNKRDLKDDKKESDSKEMPRSIMVEEPVNSQHGKEVVRDMKKNGPRREKLAQLSENKIEKIAASKLAKFGRDTVENYLKTSVGPNVGTIDSTVNDSSESDDDESESYDNKE